MRAAIRSGSGALMWSNPYSVGWQSTCSSRNFSLSFLAEFSRWFRLQVEAGSKAQAASGDANRQRLTVVEREIGNLVTALADGSMGGSRALAATLRALEEERDQLAKVQPVRGNVVSIVPKLAERFRELVM
jgi:hypothetical protein